MDKFIEVEVFAQDYLRSDVFDNRFLTKVLFNVSHIAFILHERYTTRKGKVEFYHCITTSIEQKFYIYSAEYDRLINLLKKDEYDRR